VFEHASFDSMIDAGPGTTHSEAWAVNKIDPQCKIYGFEPCTHRFDKLKESGYPGMLRNLAIADVDGEIEGGMGHEKGRSDFVTNACELNYELGLYEKVTVGATTIDKIVDEENLNNVFIWADIEGAELLLLQGAQNSLKEKKIAALVLELNLEIDPVQRNFCRDTEVIHFLSRYDYYAASGLDPQTSMDVYGAEWLGISREVLFLPRSSAMAGYGHPRQGLGSYGYDPAKRKTTKEAK